MFVRYVCKVIGTGICILYALLQNPLEIDPTPIIARLSAAGWSSLKRNHHRHRMLTGTTRNLSYVPL